MPFVRCPVCRVLVKQDVYRRHTRAHRGPQPSGRYGSTRQWRKLRDRVIARDKGCVVCGTPNDLQVHHIHPKAEGGTDELWNLEARCTDHH